MVEDNNENLRPGSDEERIRRFINHLTRNQIGLYSYILSLVPHSSDADDIMQEMTAVMWQKFSEFSEGTDFRRWGIAIARNLVYRYWNQKKRTHRQLSESTLESLEDEFHDMSDEQGEQLDYLRTCLKKLSEPDHRLIMMRYESGMDVKEIAGLRDKTVQAVYKALGRIHSILLRCVRRSMIAAEMA